MINENFFVSIAKNTNSYIFGTPCILGKLGGWVGGWVVMLGGAGIVDFTLNLLVL